MAEQPEGDQKQPEQKVKPLSEQEQNPAAKLLARRRKLLKGLAAGVPAIITLQSGAALAASSSTCARENNITTQPAGGRCQASDPGTGLRFVQDNDASWGTDGPCTNNTEYAAVYVTGGGSYGSAGNNFGGAAADDAAPATSPQYYAVTTSCWTSFD